MSDQQNKPQLARVVWRSKVTGLSGKGEPILLESAVKRVQLLNVAWGTYIDHWVELVEPEEKTL